MGRIVWAGAEYIFFSINNSETVDVTDLLFTQNNKKIHPCISCRWEISWSIGFGVIDRWSAKMFNFGNIVGIEGESIFWNRNISYTIVVTDSLFRDNNNKIFFFTLSEEEMSQSICFWIFDRWSANIVISHNNHIFTCKKVRVMYSSELIWIIHSKLAISCVI